MPDLMLCPICGLPMIHSRTHGSYCYFEARGEAGREIDMRTVIKAMAKRAKHNQPMRAVRSNR